MFENLKQSVGPGKPNRQEDVRLVQRLLNRQASRTGIEIAQTGQFDRATQAGVEAFQRRIMRMYFPNSMVTPGDETFRQLSMTSPQRLMAGSAGSLRLPYRTGDIFLKEEDYTAAAKLSCEVRAVKAVTMVEAPRGAYDDYGRPTILFERHLFHRLHMVCMTGRYLTSPTPTLEVTSAIPLSTSGWNERMRWMPLQRCVQRPGEHSKAWAIITHKPALGMQAYSLPPCVSLSSNNSTPLWPL